MPTIKNWDGRLRSLVHVLVLVKGLKNQCEILHIDYYKRTYLVNMLSYHFDVLRFVSLAHSQ